MKKRTRPPNRYLAAVVGVLLFAAACGGSDDSAASDVCDGEVTVDTIEAWAHEGSEADAYKEIVDDFNASVGADLGLTVNLTLVPESSYTDQVNAAAAAGDLPALLDYDGPNLANLAWAGNVVPVENCISDDLRGNLLSSIVEGGSYNGDLYGVGSFDSGLGLYAYKSVLEGVGARIPTGADDAWTTEEFQQILEDLQAAGYAHPLDIKIWYGTQGEWMTYGFSPITQSAGSDLIDRDSLKADGVLNSPEVVDALTLFQSWATDGLIDTEAVDDSNFLSGDAPLSWVGHWMYNTYAEEVGDDLIVLPLPDFGSGTRTGMGSWAWAITSAGSDIDADAAWAFIEYATTDDSILKITDVNGAVPATTSALSKAPNFAEGGPLVLFREQLEGAPDIAVPRPITPGYPTVTSEFWTALDKILLGEDVQTALDAAASAIDSDVDDNEGYPEPGS